MKRHAILPLAFLTGWVISQLFITKGGMDNPASIVVVSVCITLSITLELFGKENNKWNS